MNCEDYKECKTCPYWQICWADFVEDMIKEQGND